MPSLDHARSAVHDLLVDVVDADRAAIEPEATLASLGVDSLSVVEICEILGARFDVEIPDDAIDAVTTVDDVVHALLTAPDRSAVLEPVSAPLGPAPGRPAPSLNSEEITARKRRALVLIAWFAVIGVGLGLLIGVGGSALFRASGLGDLDPVPIPEPTETATETTGPAPAPSPTPTEEDEEEEEEDEESTLEASPANAAAGSRITLTGAVPEASPGAQLQVQRQEAGGEWQDFPVTVTLNDDGSFSTWIQTSRQGTQEFRLQVIGSDIATPTVQITVS